MRPLGESISTPNSRYVGHAFRQRPQWTHLSRSDCAGPIGFISSITGGLDAAIQTRTVQQVVRIEHVLDLFHDGKPVTASARLRREPQLMAFADLVRCVLHDCTPRARLCGFPKRL